MERKGKDESYDPLSKEDFNKYVKELYLTSEMAKSMKPGKIDKVKYKRRKLK